MAKKKPKPRKAPKPAAPRTWPEKLLRLRRCWGTPGKPLTQTEAAARIKVTARSWSSWETGDREPSPTVGILIDLLLSRAD